ncbi:MAG: RnfH family protein [Candidatus Phlomobacter fragariae]
MVEINIEVVYALPDWQFLLHVKIGEGASVEEVIVQSGMLSLRDDIDLNRNKVGIYSRQAKLCDILSDGDRVEIYRPLIVDPKEMRRKRAEKAKQKS